MSELRDAVAAAVEHDADIYQDTYSAADAVLAIPEIRKALAVLTLINGLLALPEPVWLSTQGRGHELWTALREAVES